MDIYFKCLCGKSLAVDAKGIGLTISCPECGQELKIPEPARKIRCDCGTTILAPESMVGENVQCMNCKIFCKVPMVDSDGDSSVKESYKGLSIQRIVGRLQKVKTSTYALILFVLVSVVVATVLMSINNFKSSISSEYISGTTDEAIVMLDNKTQTPKSQSEINNYTIENSNRTKNNKFAIEIGSNVSNPVSDNTITILTNKQVIEAGKTSSNFLIITNIAVKNNKDIPSQVRPDSNSWRILKESEEVETAITKASQCTNSQQAVDILDIAVSRNAYATNINRAKILHAKLKDENNRNLREEKSIKPMFSNISDSLMIIEGEISRGSGFILLMEGKKYLITNRHVMMGTKKLKVKSVNDYTPKIKSYELGVDADLVRMEIDESENVKCLVLSKTVNMNDPIVVYGNSEGMGVVTEIKGVINGIGPDVIETTAEFVSGNSGSPIINEKGEVLGVATFATQNKMQDWITQGTRFESIRRFGLRMDFVQWRNVSFNEFSNQSQLLIEAETYLSDLADIIILCCCIRDKNALDQKNQYLLNTFSYYLTTDKKKLLKRSRWSNELAHFVRSYDEIYKGGLTGQSAYGGAQLHLQSSVTAQKKILKETKWIDDWFQKDAKRHLDFIEFLSSNISKYLIGLPVPHK